MGPARQAQETILMESKPIVKSAFANNSEISFYCVTINGFFSPLRSSALWRKHDRFDITQVDL
jgi:hypothetical protein